MDIYIEPLNRHEFWIFNVGNTETKMQTKLRGAGWEEYRTSW
jgi:hypothetical protein